MLRSIAAVPLLLLLMAVAIDARATLSKATTKKPLEVSTYMTLPEGTITVGIDSDVILTTGPEGETFTEASPLELTEEPLPDSVIQQLQLERAEEQRSHKFEESATEVEAATTTEQPSSTPKTFKFGAPNLPLGFNTPLKNFSTLKPEYVTTDKASREDTTQYEELTTLKNYFGNRPTNLEMGDLEMAENRMETTTDAPEQAKSVDSTSTPLAEDLSMIMTTEVPSVEEMVTIRGEGEPEKSVATTVSPLFRFFSTSPAVSVVTERQPELTTVIPEAQEEEATTATVQVESTEVPLPSSTQTQESITKVAETTTSSAPSSTPSTEPEPLTARINLYQNAQPETSSTASDTETTTLTASVPEITTLSTSAPDITTFSTSAPEITTSTTSAPESTTTSTTSVPETTATSTTSVPETTTTSTTGAPETTTSTTSAPETSTSTTSAPETSTSTTSAPETTISTTSAPETTTSTTRAPETTTSTTSAPATTTTTTARPILTRAPRVERIFNSDGVEVLYGYSSVVRTNRS